MFKEILLPVDLGNPETQSKAINTAVELAKTYDCRLHIITIVPDLGESVVSSFFPVDFQEKAMESAKQRLHAFVAERIPKGIKVQHIVAHGSIYGQIVDFAKKIDADLIVMGSHRPAVRDYLLGANATQVTRNADCSVMVVRD